MQDLSCILAKDQTSFCYKVYPILWLIDASMSSLCNKSGELPVALRVWFLAAICTLWGLLYNIFMHFLLA